MTQKGFLVISDITGYTAFLSASELEHAEDILTSLLNLLIEHTRSPLVIAKLEGDAVFSYALTGSFHQGQTLMEAFETTYVAFRRAVELMMLNTTCSCNACRNIPTLDLKFFVHYGSFVVQSLGAYYELLGTDVNLLHRLLKNHITEETGFKAYAVYTQEAVEALGIQEICARLVSHVETYANIGDIHIYVQDMHALWDRERDRVRFVVTPEQAAFQAEHDFSIPAPLLWDYITKPEYRAIFMEAIGQKLDRDENARIGQGSVYYCAHENRVSEHTILDWQPFEQYTTRETLPLPGGAFVYSTYRLTPIEAGTRLTVSNSHVHGLPLVRGIGNFLMGRMLPGMVQRGIRALQQRIQEDLAEGQAVLVSSVDVSKEEIDRVVKEGLSSEGHPGGLP
ncbi:MAG TPA: DUF2652 domain-containing protein [Anaerolineales bacterium]|nr:DUF2652 domain-containing protein [Anaerolineales bacterium]